MLYVNVIYFLEKEARPVQMNSAQYSSDGEKMEQGLKFTLQGLRLSFYFVLTKRHCYF